MKSQSSALSFEQLEIGHRWVSETRTISQEDVCCFADLTGDRDRLHVDPEFAARGPFGRPIAHGMLGMSILAGLSSTAPYVKTSALVDIRNWSFCRPLFPGDSVQVITEIVELRPHGRRHGEVHWHRQLINQKGDKLQEGVLVTLVARQSPLTTNPNRTEPQPASLSTPAPTPLLEGV